MKNLRVVIYPIIVLLVFMTACGDSSQTINDMAKELKENQVFQKNGFRDKEIEVSLSDQSAFDLLVKINKLSKEIIILRLKSYGLEGVYRKKIQSLEKVLKKGRLSQIQLSEVTEKIEKTKSQLAEETKRLRLLRKLIDKNLINLKKMKRDFNKMDYVIKL
ncbi:MAG: hypothetical protein CBB92_02450 [Flammeovirgaceae bacterium TMED32]|nr:MAG: hypothetical protein CBB92_02450 [Flammeovirgaceae bacterium TMED32]|tara:strand:+ start:3486 stop:3968 length:483 start_codon:yes stop_codon:yes gene_type:complete